MDDDISEHMEIATDVSLNDFMEVFANASEKNKKWINERLNKYTYLVQTEKDQIESWSEGLTATEYCDPYYQVLILYLSLMYTYIDSLQGAVDAMIDYSK